MAVVTTEGEGTSMKGAAAGCVRLLDGRGDIFSRPMGGVNGRSSERIQ